MIRQEGDKWCLFTADGSRKLGCHDTRDEALAQERAVQANKALLMGTGLWPGDVIEKGSDDGQYEEEEFYVEAAIVKTLDEKRLAYGIFLVPFVEDLQGDIVSDDQVQKAAHEFLMRSRRIRDMHANDIKADLVESAIAPPGGMNWHGKFVPEGTWVGAVKVQDPEEWLLIKQGKRRGFSVRMRGRKLVEVAA